MNPYLMPSIETGPKVVLQLLRLIPAARWDTSLNPDRFTLREVIAHLADWEPIMRQRVQTAVNSPGGAIEAYDEGQMAIDNNYSTTNPFDEANKFARERHITAEYLSIIATGQMANTVTHPERGVLSADDLANMLLGHDLYHIEQLTGYLLDSAR